MSNVRIPAALVALVLCLAAGCTEGTTDQPAPTSQPATTAGATADCRTEPTGPEEFQYSDIDGVDPDLTSLDIYLPAGCDPAPVVMWVHGGGWRRGDKVQSVGFKAELANSLGAALVSVNYRLSTPGSGVKWPDHGKDVAAAIGWVQAHGAEHGLDATRMALMGHSAGGHLVSIVVVDPSLLAAGSSADTVACVVALDSASYDLAGSPAEESGLVPNAFGTDPEVVADASPQVQVERNGAPPADFLVVTRGSDGRVAGAQRFVDALNAGGGGTAALSVARPYSHEDVSRKLGEPGEDIVTPAVRQFLQQCLDR